MRLIRRFIRQLLCRHEWVFERNIYGDEINHVGGMRSWWRCAKCGKRSLDPHLHVDHDDGENGRLRALVALMWVYINEPIGEHISQKQHMELLDVIVEAMQELGIEVE